MAARLSGSFIVYEGYDFNAALVTATAAVSTAASTSSTTAPTIDEFVRKILDEWAAGGASARATCSSRTTRGGARCTRTTASSRCPIFWEGRARRVVGHRHARRRRRQPCPRQLRRRRAEDRFGEAPLFPAIKMVEDFEPLWDVERAYLRNSRTPELNALNMRARAGRDADDPPAHPGDLRAVRRRDASRRPGGDHRLRRARRAQRLREMPDGCWYPMPTTTTTARTNVMYPICCR